MDKGLDEQLKDRMKPVADAATRNPDVVATRPRFQVGQLINIESHIFEIKKLRGREMVLKLRGRAA